MIIKSSSSLCKDYDSFSELAHNTNEPIYITKGGEGDLVLLSIDAYEKRENIIREKILSELSVSENIDTAICFNERTDGKMTEFTLGRILRAMYDLAAKGDQVAYIHLFSIYYAEDIEKNRLNKKEMLKVANLSESYQTEISKGIRLAALVTVKEEQVAKIKEIEKENT